MYKYQKEFQMPVSDVTKESAKRMMGDLQARTFEEHKLTNTAIPSFREKQVAYLAGYVRCLSSRNYQHLLRCRGEEE